MDTDSFSDLDDEGSGLELVHVADVLDYLGEYTLSEVSKVVKYGSIVLSLCFILGSRKKIMIRLFPALFSCDSCFKFFYFQEYLTLW